MISLATPRPSAADPLWYKDAVIYQLHVKSFADSNGDGVGDFKGLTAKLTYLSDLGVDCDHLPDAEAARVEARCSRRG